MEAAFNPTLSPPLYEAKAKGKKKKSMFLLCGMKPTHFTHHSYSVHQLLPHSPAAPQHIPATVLPAESEWCCKSKRKETNHNPEPGFHACVWRVEPRNTYSSKSAYKINWARRRENSSSSEPKCLTSGIRIKSTKR